MKIPTNAPNTIHKLLDALCNKSNTGCITCEECPFARYGVNAEDDKNKAQMFKALNAYIAHLRMTS